MKKKIQWHPGFCAAMELEFRENRQDLEYDREHTFSRKPLQADLLVIKKRPEIRIKNEIGEIFRTWNVLEYKSPEDSLDIDDFYKVNAYACLLKAQADHVDEYPAGEITVTMIREGYPGALVAALEKNGLVVTERKSGILEVEGKLLFRTQIIVYSRLANQSHVWLKALTARIGKMEFQKFADSVSGLQEKYERECASAVLAVVAGANRESVIKWREDVAMFEALAEIMEPELTERERRGREEGERRGREEGIKLTKLVLRMDAEGFECSEIAEKAGITEEDVRAILA